MNTHLVSFIFWANSPSTFISSRHCTRPTRWMSSWWRVEIHWTFCLIAFLNRYLTNQRSPNIIKITKRRKTPSKNMITSIKCFCTKVSFLDESCKCWVPPWRRTCSIQYTATSLAGSISSRIKRDTLEAFARYLTIVTRYVRSVPPKKWIDLIPWLIYQWCDGIKEILLIQVIPVEFQCVALADCTCHVAFLITTER